MKKSIGAPFSQPQKQQVSRLERAETAFLTNHASTRKNLQALVPHPKKTNVHNDADTESVNCATSIVTDDDDDWLSLAQDTIVQELNSLFEEYTFATAKDASVTDTFRDSHRDGEQQQQHSEDSLVYGEVDIQGFCRLLLEIDHTSTGYFYDLGSGSGRAVFAARYCGDYQACIGVELLPNLHQLAVSVASLYKFRHYQDKLHQDHRQVQFVCSDLLEYEPWWSHPPEDRVTLYIPNLLFDTAMSDRIAQKALRVQPGTIVMCLKQFTLPEWADAFLLVQQMMVVMSWGESCVYVYHRRETEAAKALSSGSASEKTNHEHVDETQS